LSKQEKEWLGVFVVMMLTAFVLLFELLDLFWD